jgi:hypothetical protein
MTHIRIRPVRGTISVLIFALGLSTAWAGLDSNSTVFIILMENENWSFIKGNSSAPYINSVLLPMASHAEQYFTPPGIHPSLPNYLWLEAGTNFGILDDNAPSANHQSTTNHFVTQLKQAGISWKSYQEDISGTTCPLSNSGSYAVRHNPVVYFDDVTCNTNPSCAYCIANVRPYSELANDLANNTVPRYNFLTPDLCDDMHNSCPPISNRARQGDTWLSNNIPMILNSQAYNNGGVILITWDEGFSNSDGPIGMIVLSPYAKGGGYSNTVHYTHSSTLRTMQKIFGVRPFLNDTVNAIDLSDLFIPGAIPNGDPFAPDGTVDTTNYVQSATNMYIWAAVNGTTLYVATGSPGTNGPSDHFIIVTDQLLPTASQPAFPAWSKTGSNAVSTNKPYLGGESANSFCGWFNAPIGSQAAKWPNNTRQMEGTIDLVAAFGPSIMTGTVYIVTAAYGTANGSALASQGPASLNSDGNIDSNEFLAVPVAALRDSNLDGLYDRFDPALDFIVSGAQPVAGGGTTITWNTEPGRSYQVQFADALGSPTVWQDLPNGQTNAPPGQYTLSLTDPDITATQRFYRVKLLNP